MEFFSWMQIPEIFLSYFSVQLEDISAASVIAYQMRIFTISLIIAAGLYLLGHLFGGFGLYKIAKRAGDKFAWMAFVPVLCTYLSGRLAGETNIFGVKCKRIGLYAAIAEFLYIVLNIFLLIIGAYLANPQWNSVTTQEYNGTTFITGTEYIIENMPVGIRWLPTTELVLQIVTDVWSFVLLAIFIFLFMAFFRKYYARSPIIMAFLCSFFPVRGYVLFAVRNNAPVDYNEWMQERFRRMQQQQYGGYPNGGYGPTNGGNGPTNGSGGYPNGGNGPTNGSGGYPNGGNGPTNGSGGEPFSDVTGSSGDDEPFSDL